MKNINNIYQNCDTCKITAKTPSRPIVCMPMTIDFNEIIAVDLKLWQGKLILHIGFAISDIQQRPYLMITAVNLWEKKWLN